MKVNVDNSIGLKVVYSDLEIKEVSDTYKIYHFEITSRMIKLIKSI